jgi:hypothetical protein
MQLLADGTVGADAAAICVDDNHSIMSHHVNAS